MYRLLLGVSGGIAAYKVPDFVHAFIKRGGSVTVVLTDSSELFVSKLVLSTLSAKKVWSNEDFFSSSMPHISLIREHDVMAVIPCTANHLSFFSMGAANSLLSALFLSFQGKKILFPSMHHEMFNNPYVQNHLEKLQNFGTTVIYPEFGELACGDKGDGRLASIDIILDIMTMAGYSPLSALKGKRVLITAGGTQESIDDVRYISNRSTGMLGRAMAILCQLNGAAVTLLDTKGYNTEFLSKSLTCLSVQDMEKALLANIESQDILIMAAAISDFTTESFSSKLKREDTAFLKLKPTKDLLKLLIPFKENKLFVGFSLGNYTPQEIKKKCKDKGLDFIISNNVSAIGSLQRTASLWTDKSHCVDWVSCSVWNLAFNIIEAILPS